MLTNTPFLVRLNLFRLLPASSCKAVCQASFGKFCVWAYPSFLVVFLLFAFLLFLPPATKCQERTLRFEKYGVENGLHTEQIMDILEDRLGFIWLATVDGLFKFDGYHFKAYLHVPQDNSTIAHPIVLQLVEDSKGGIWVVTQTGLSLYHRKTDSFQRLLPDGHPDPPGNVVEAVLEDENQTIWVGTMKGLYKFEARDSTFLPVAKPPGTNGDIDIRCIRQDSKGRIWAGWSQGLLRLDAQKMRLEHSIFNPENTNLHFATGTIYDIEEDNTGTLWLGTAAGTRTWRPAEKKWSPAPLPDSLVNQSVRDILLDRHQNLWLAFQVKGLAQVDLKNRRVRHFQRSPFLPQGLANDQLHSLMLDRADNLWIGTTQGCQKINLSAVKFPVFQVKPGMEATENFIIRLHQDNLGGIWTTAANGKLFHAPALGGKPQLLFFDGAPHPLSFTFYHSGSDNIVRATHGKSGVFVFSEANGAWQKMDLGDTINTRPSKVLFEDALDPGVFWIGNEMGLCKWNKRTGKRHWFYPSADLPSFNSFVNNMVQLPDGNILVNVGGFGAGTLALFNPVAKRFKPLVFSKDKPDQPAIIAVRNFALTKKQGVWMATPGGLVNYDLVSQKCHTLTSENGLPTTSVMSVLSDEKDNLWVAFDGWLSNYAPAIDSIVSFDVRAEMEGFYSGTCSKGLDGSLLFGGSSGIMAFHPDSVWFDATPPRVTLTGFKVLNRTRHFGTAPELIRHITLTHRDNIFSFQFSALNFTDSKNVRYKYKLEGFNEEWIDADPERTATYTNLEPDSYVFRVIACNSDGVWSEESLAVELTIKPPLWATWWAKILYAALIFSALYFAYRFQLNRKLEHAETLRLRELDTVKTRLYTNITHEFRTPLTIISGMAEEMKLEIGKLEIEKFGGSQISNFPISNFCISSLDMIKRNSQNLLRFVNQMLDLSKIESGNMPLHLVQGDVVGYLKYIVESFHSLAEAKNIRLEMHSELPELVMDFDEEKLLQIVSNLLSNAIKFTLEGGEVALRLTVSPNSSLAAGFAKLDFGDTVVLSISDTGIGIPPEKLPHIFERFYQADDEATRHAEGSGIGLTLSKELVKLLGGEISVKSEVGKGTSFEVRLPLRNVAGTDLSESFKLSERLGTISGTDLSESFKLSERLPSPTNPQILLIEDNSDVVRYLAAFLEKFYRVEVARNGREGVEKALETIPDLVISDVMMPEMDGFEVCRTLKNDVRTSHIPLVLLTAKADAASKIEGLERGADAYLAKPFDKVELLVRIRKLLELRQNLQQHYLALATAPVAILPLGKEKSLPPTALENLGEGAAMENAFVQKIKAIVETHLDDAGFDLPQLSRHAAMSSSQLHRKLVALTGLSPNRFIRQVRLAKAKILLIESEESVNAIAYDTGFTDPDYFSRIFKQETGLTPTAFKEQERRHGLLALFG